MRVVFSPDANREVDHLTDWLIERSPHAARKASEAMLRGFRSLSDFPHSGRLVEDDERELVIEFGRDGFVALYRVEADWIVILRVFHGRRQR